MIAIFTILKEQRVRLFCIPREKEPRIHYGHYPKSCQILELDKEVQFSCSVVSDSLWPHGLQHARLSCPSPIPGACSNSCASSRWCHQTVSFSVVPFSRLQSFPVSESFPNESVLPIRWPKYWSFSFNISPANEHSRTDLGEWWRVTWNKDVRMGPKSGMNTIARHGRKLNVQQQMTR